jgi:hypothetical protein
MVVENIFENFNFENSDNLELNNKVKCQQQISNDWWCFGGRLEIIFPETSFKAVRSISQTNKNNKFAKNIIHNKIIECFLNDNHSTNSGW